MTRFLRERNLKKGFSLVRFPRGEHLDSKMRIECSNIFLRDRNFHLNLNFEAGKKSPDPRSLLGGDKAKNQTSVSP